MCNYVDRPDRNILFKYILCANKTCSVKLILTYINNKNTKLFFYSEIKDKKNLRGSKNKCKNNY